MNIQMAGIRNVEDAKMCVKAGVNIIGLLVGQMHNSDDFITKERALEIKKSIPKKIKTTLITHLENAEEIIEIAKYVGVNYIQLHSYIDESEVDIIRDALPKVKLVRLIHISEGGTVLTDYSKYRNVDYYFTDSINLKTNQVGGTGLTHNFETDANLVKQLEKPTFVAGGLTPNNVEEVVRLCKPYGVDVNSGCRAIDGGRDKKKVEEFVKKANVWFGRDYALYL